MPSTVLVCVLASGSRGNCTLVKTGSTSILIDAGLSYAQLSSHLSVFGLRPQDIDHLLITHEHSDHVSGLSSLVRKHPLPVHLNRETHLQIEHLIKDPAAVNLFDSAFEIDDIKIDPFAISHDAVNPVGYLLSIGELSICLATDMGFVTDSARLAMQQADVLVLESNHDERMLMIGNYPSRLKQRVAGSRGHLSNRQAAECLASLVTARHRHVILAHLSEENNRPELATACVENHLTGAHRPRLHVALQHRMGPVIEL